MEGVGGRKGEGWEEGEGRRDSGRGKEAGGEGSRMEGVGGRVGEGWEEGGGRRDRGRGRGSCSCVAEAFMNI